MKKLALKILTSSSSARSPSSTATIMVPEMAPFYAVTFLLMKKKIVVQLNVSGGFHERFYTSLFL